jgi:cytolysin-activating lysine-acyltransferase
MVKLDYYASIGFALELLAKSPYHRQHKIGDYLRIEVLPAIAAKQVRFYMSEDSVPSAFVTWAWLSKEVEKDIHSTGRALTQDEWKCGNHLFFNDWITPYNNIREVLHDMTHHIFPDQAATSLRRNQDGSVRRINRWTGINLRRVEEEAIV